jgi:hypothetical protein
MVKTLYTGKVVPIAGTTIVLITGRFTRTTITDASEAFTTASGDWETEKPT